jgi:MFS family permease
MSDFLAYFRLLRLPRFLAFFASQILTNLADGLMAVAVIYFAIKLDASPWQLGVITSAIILSRGFLGPIGGLIGDRMDKRTYLICIEVLRCGLMFLLYVTYAMGFATIWVLMPFGILISTCFAISVPVAKSIIPKLVPQADLQPANALIQTVTWPAYFIGSGLLAAILPLDLESLIFALVGAFFAISVLMLTRLPTVPLVAATVGVQKPSLTSDLAQGYTELRLDSVLHARVWAYGIFTFFWRGSLQILLPLALLSHLGSPEWLFGALMLVNGVTEFFASLYVGTLRLKKPLLFTFCCEPLLAIGLLAVAASFIMPVPEIGLLVGVILIGIAAAIIDIPLLTVIQMKVSENNIGKVVSYWFTIGSTGGALGSLCLGLWFEVMPFAIGTAILGLALLVVGAGLYLWAVARNTFVLTIAPATPL